MRRLNIESGTCKVTINYAKFQVSTPWGLGRSWQAASNLSAVAAGRSQSYAHTRVETR